MQEQGRVWQGTDVMMGKGHGEGEGGRGHGKGRCGDSVHSGVVSHHG